MKKTIIFILYVIGIMIIFSGCNLNPLNKDQFDLRDTVTIKVGEKLYENKDLWVRLDSITKDTRCPVGWQCYVAGRVEAKFTVGFKDTSVTFYLSPDTLYLTPDSISIIAGSVFFAFSQVPGGSYYWLYHIGTRPERESNVEIPQSSYEVDFVLEQGDMVWKPNIYLYPNVQTKMDLSLNFPQGGEVIKSIPAFPDKWENIKVKPSGLIDNEYDYLFYEAALPDRWQVDEGWSVKKQNLRTFFQINLTEYGFNKREIADFTDYWIPRLNTSPYYAIYPQHTSKIDEVVELNISKNPKSILRLFYVIKEIPEHEDMLMPMIPEFERKGFTVTEWGVILK